MNPQAQPVFVLQPQPQPRPILAWLFAVAMAILAANNGKLPTLPTLPPFPFPTQPAPQAPAVPPTAPAPQAPPPAAQPTAAICRIQFGNAGCTAAPILPRREDGRALMLTAAHCVNGVGQRGKAVFKDGRTFAVSVVARDANTDCAFLLTDEPAPNLPALKLADKSPEVGAKVWHAGYGVDKPTNREDGERLATETTSGKIAFVLSVSSGDSGGPIMRADTNEIVSCVCCTTERGRKVEMYGASVESIRALLARVSVSEEWEPDDLPILTPTK